MRAIELSELSDQFTRGDFREYNSHSASAVVHNFTQRLRSMLSLVPRPATAAHSLILVQPTLLLDPPHLPPFVQTPRVCERCQL